MFDSETVAFVSGECDASSMKVAFFSQVQPCSSSILRGNRTVSTVPGLCDSEIWHFLVARRAFVTCLQGPKIGMVWGPRGVASPVPIILLRLINCIAAQPLLLSLSLILQQLRLSCWLRKQERNCERL